MNAFTLDAYECIYTSTSQEYTRQVPAKMTHVLVARAEEGARRALARRATRAAASSTSPSSDTVSTCPCLFLNTHCHDISKTQDAKTKDASTKRAITFAHVLCLSPIFVSLSVPGSLLVGAAGAPHAQPVGCCRGRALGSQLAWNHRIWVFPVRLHLLERLPVRCPRMHASM